MSVEIVHISACGCRGTWEVSQLGDKPAVVRGSHPCIPEHCQDCINHGRPCPTREGMGGIYTYEPVEFAEVGPKPRYSRMKSK